MSPVPQFQNSRNLQIVMSCGPASVFPSGLFLPSSAICRGSAGLWVLGALGNLNATGVLFIFTLKCTRASEKTPEDSSDVREGSVRDLRLQGSGQDRGFSVEASGFFILSLTKSWRIVLLRRDKLIHIYICSQSPWQRGCPGPIPIPSAAK